MSDLDPPTPDEIALAARAQRGPYDFDRDEIDRGAADALRELNRRGIHAVAYFRATCPYCGERSQFSEPNRLYELMECSCGRMFPFVRGNYSIMVLPPGVDPPVFDAS